MNKLLICLGSMGIAVRALIFWGRERAMHAPYPKMWPLITAIPGDPQNIDQR